MPHRPEPETPALDAFLEGARMRRLLGVEAAARFQALFAPEGPARALDPESHPHRILAMWRIVRATAVAKGLCSDEETLEEATELDFDPWHQPFLPMMLPTGQQALRKAEASRLLKIHSRFEGLPLLPPRGPLDVAQRWCNAAAIVAKGLGIERTQEGQQGLQGLLDPKLCEVCDVTASEVLAFEELIFDECLELLLDVGERAAVRHLMDAYGFSRKEVSSVFKCAKAQATTRTTGSIEEKRALQEARLESYLSRCKETLDMDGEMKALKELAKVQGLTRTSPENVAAEFEALVSRVSQKQDKEMLDPETLQLLNGKAERENVQPVMIEGSSSPSPEEDIDDAEALAEFDKENR